MESIPKIIIITGIPSSGKTTFSRILAKLLGCKIVEIDLIYFEVAKELGVEKSLFCNFRNWKNLNIDVEKANALKEKYYKSFSEHIKDNTIMFEGFGFFLAKDRDILRKLYPKSEIILMEKQVNYNKWLDFKNNHCTKIDCERTKQEYENLMNSMQKISVNENIEHITIK
jgi:adenylate kinase